VYLGAGVRVDTVVGYMWRCARVHSGALGAHGDCLRDAAIVAHGNSTQTS